MNELFRNGCLLLGMAFLPACQSGGPVDTISLSTPAKPQTLIVSVGKLMQKCWFKSGNRTFRSFRLANETNSFAGRPRLLLVPKNKPTGLPSLVVQAENHKGATQLQIFGPLLSTQAGQAISADIKNWTSGKTTCATKTR
jgi:hypothetical protein